MKLDIKTQKLLYKPENRWRWIVYQLRDKDLSIAQIAKKAKVTRQCINNAKKYAYPKMEKLLANALNIEPYILFPERYHQAGKHKGKPNGLHAKKSLHVNSNTSVKSRNVNSDKGNRHAA